MLSREYENCDFYIRASKNLRDTQYKYNAEDSFHLSFFLFSYLYALSPLFSPSYLQDMKGHVRERTDEVDILRNLILGHDASCEVLSFFRG